MAQHEVYHDINLIEATLKDCGVDIENAGTFHGLNAKGKAKVIEELARRSGHRRVAKRRSRPFRKIH